MLIVGKALVPLLYDFWLVVSLLCLRWKLKGSELLRDISAETSSATTTSSWWWLFGGCKLQGQSWTGPAAGRCLWKVRIALPGISLDPPPKIISICSMLMWGNREVRPLCKMIPVSFHPIQPSEKLVLHPPTPLKGYAPFNVWDEEQGEDKRWKRRTVITVGPRSYSVLN